VEVIGVWDGPEEARRWVTNCRTAGARRRFPERHGHIWCARSSRRASSKIASSRSGCPIASSAGSASTSAPKIRDALAYLRLVIRLPMTISRSNASINQPKRGLGDKALATDAQPLRRTGLPLAAAAATGRQ
jgi:DNA helicase II / ATP-dependent DNA helicase PcrA